MTSGTQIDIEIDKLTRSIENVITGYSFKPMVKESKNIDFYTTGRQLSDQEFKLISEWICKKKKLTQAKSTSSKRKRLSQHSVLLHQASK